MSSSINMPIRRYLNGLFFLRSDQNPLKLCFSLRGTVYFSFTPKKVISMQIKKIALNISETPHQLPTNLTSHNVEALTVKKPKVAMVLGIVMTLVRSVGSCVMAAESDQ
ncbi:hypothetical protein D3C81_1615330 [compost metagenome]